MGISYRIAFFLDTRTFQHGISFEGIENGNPGIGGSEYMLLLLCAGLSKINGIQITLFTTSRIDLDDKIIQFNEIGLTAVLEKIDLMQFDFLIVNQSNIHINHFYDIDKLKHLKLIVWTHTYIDYLEADKISNSKNILRNVFVGKQHYDYYYDHKIIYKSTFIFHGIPNNLFRERLKLDNAVVFMGGLYYSKYFHVLAKQWKKILKSVPDAKLYVIGSAQLYDKNIKIGNYFAEKSYESYFLKFLKDEDGSIHSSVTFLGNLGIDKNEIFQNSKVGVVNPTGITETFCISAVEMQSMGLPVVTKNSFSYPDVIVNKLTGLLYSHERKLASTIIRLLKNEYLRRSFGLNAIKHSREKFSVDIFVNQWILLFSNLQKSIPIDLLDFSKPYTSQLKWLKIFNRYLQDKFELKTNSVIQIQRNTIDYFKNSDVLILKYMFEMYRRFNLK